MEGRKQKFRLSYSWRIPAAWSELKDREGIESEVFSSGAEPSVTWRLRFYRNGPANTSTTLGPCVYLVCDSSPSNISATWTFSWLFSSGELHALDASSEDHNLSFHRQFKPPKQDDSHKLGQGTQVKRLMDELKWADGSMVLHCDLRYSRVSEPLSTEAAGILPLRTSELLFSPELSDLSVQVGDVSIPAHKVVLHGQSAVLGRMLTQPAFSEAREGRLKVDDADEATVRAFLQFLYTGRTERMASHKEELLALADKYEVASLKAACEEELKSSLCPSSLCRLAGLADAHKAEGLMGACVALAGEASALPRDGWWALLRDRPRAAGRLAEALLTFREEPPAEGEPPAKQEPPAKKPRPAAAEQLGSDRE